MQKIILMVFILLCINFTTVCAHDTQRKTEKDARFLRLTQNAELADLTVSPDGKWIVFVQKSNYAIPSNCFYFSEKGERAKEIWIINVKEMTKKLLVAPHFSCRDVSKVIIDPHNLQFSPNSKTLY
ncbi:MAG TPA: hypothetical protein VLH77_03075, partial [Gammaproteobacteria bacterium]|nr:hypothetical protein [Gammaproteobacteria bacterium]